MKEKLLGTSLIEDNLWLDKYIDTIFDNRLDKHINGVSERHHGFPVSLSNRLGIEVDNSKSNIFDIEYKYHILAHAYLTLCAIDFSFKCANSYAFLFMTNNLGRIGKIEDDEFMSYLEELQKHHKELYMSGVEKPDSTKHKLKNLRWCNDGKREIHYKVGEDIPKGFTKGRLPSPRYSENVKGKIWINNGVEQHLIFPEELPKYKGFNLGMLYRGEEWKSNIRKSKENVSIETKAKLSCSRKKYFDENPDKKINKGSFKPNQTPHNKGSFSITNGISNRYVKEEYQIPEGWWRGNT